MKITISDPQKPTDEDGPTTSNTHSEASETIDVPPSFPIVRAINAAGVTEAHDFVQGLLTEGGASVVYGPSNCGKSFWIIDLARCVASGEAFRDELETEIGAVVYVALEGSFGVRNRLEALRHAGHISDETPLFLCFAPLSLLEMQDTAMITESIKQASIISGLPCRLVILDTLARAMAGGDENRSTDMTAAVKAIDMIRGETGAHVCIIHHCGKDEAKGARGHSSLRAAVDTELEVYRPEGGNISTVRTTKQRDMPLGEPMPFSLKQVELGTDRRGNPITSCTVHHEDSIMAQTRTKPGRKRKVSDSELLELLPMPTTSAWQQAAQDELGLGKSAFHDALRSIKDTSAYRDSDKIWRAVR